MIKLNDRMGYGRPSTGYLKGREVVLNKILGNTTKKRKSMNLNISDSKRNESSDRKARWRTVSPKQSLNFLKRNFSARNMPKKTRKTLVEAQSDLSNKTYFSGRLLTKNDEQNSPRKDEFFYPFPTKRRIRFFSKPIKDHSVTLKMLVDHKVTSTLEMEEPRHSVTFRRFRNTLKLALSKPSAPILTQFLDQQKKRDGAKSEKNGDHRFGLRLVVKGDQKQNREFKTEDDEESSNNIEDKYLQALFSNMKIWEIRDNYNPDFKNNLLMNRALRKSGIRYEAPSTKIKHVKVNSFRGMVFRMGRFLVHLKTIGVSYQMLLGREVFPIVPYSLSQSKRFMNKVQECRDHEVRSMLLKNRFLIYQIDTFGRTALHRAVQQSCTSMVLLLLSFSPSISCCDFAGRAPLSYSLLQGTTEISKLLLSKGANPWTDRIERMDEIAVYTACREAVKDARWQWVARRAFKR